MIDKTVLHDVQNKRFVLTIDNMEVQTKYRLIDDKTIEFYSTYTPPELRSQGLAAVVVNAALDYVQENNFEIIPTCWYVKKILKSRNS